MSHTLPEDGGNLLDEPPPIQSSDERIMAAQPTRFTTRLLVRPVFVAVNAIAELLFPTASAGDETSQKDRHSSAAQARAESIPIER